MPLDYDPDVSHANIENRLQMLITNMQGQAQEVDDAAANAATPAAQNKKSRGKAKKSMDLAI